MKRRPKQKESIMLTDNKIAFAVKMDRREDPDHETEVAYDIISDGIDLDGVRVIRLKEQDRREREKKIKEIIDTLAEKLGEEGSEIFREITYDTLRNLYDEVIDKYHKMIVVKGEKVKKAPGCYKIIIGDGRTRRSEEINLRE